MLYKSLSKTFKYKKSTATCRNKFIFLSFYPYVKVETCFREKITVVRGGEEKKKEKEEKDYSVFFLSVSNSCGSDEPFVTQEVLLASELEQEDVM